MKSHPPDHGGTAQTIRRSSLISAAEIGLFTGYFLMVWMLPETWLNTAAGAIAFEIASKINPYLSDYSINLSENPRYFIHSHVLATILVFPWSFILIVKRNGGLQTFQKIVQMKIDGKPLTLYAVMVTLLFLPLIFGMLWLVKPPLNGASHAVWSSHLGTPISSLIYMYLLSLYTGLIFVITRIYIVNSFGDGK